MVESKVMPISFRHVLFEAAPAVVPELAAFYGSTLGLRHIHSCADNVAVAVGETTFEFRAGRGHPFYHFAFLVPGDRFHAAHRWAADRVAVLPDEDTGDEVFDFEHWDAQALYFHDPAGSIGELIAHRGIGESGATGRFHPDELLGLSEVGIVGDPPLLADALLETFALPVWSGSVTEERGLGFIGEKARTLILSRAGRPWLPTGRPAEAHPLEVVFAGVEAGDVQLGSGGFVRGVPLPHPS
ncbi:MAG: hypothetical protein LH654_05010 [Thermoleophilia bacterium]|nr:hypothetical protein [Thermoleophilia bacterium]